MSHRPLDITIVSPGMPHHGGTLAERSLGGSESAAIHVAAALARAGHSVTAFSPGHTGVVVDGVQWLPWEMAAGYLRAAPHDVCLISRDAASATMPNAAGLTVLWCHDLALKRHGNAFTAALWQVGAIHVLSRFQYDQVLSIHGGIGPMLVQTRNGIAPAQFAGLADIERDPWKLVYGSRPERGLETALRIMERSAVLGLPWHLVVSSYDNVVEQMRGYYQSLWLRCQQLPNVTLAGPLKQSDWHREVATARGLIYPGCQGVFREISCILMLEAQALGTPVVAIDKGAIPESLGPASGVHLGDETTDPMSGEYIRSFVDALAQLADAPTWEAMHTAGPAYIAEHGYTWDAITAEWVTHWRARLALRHANPWSVERGLVRNGDHEALAALLGEDAEDAA